VVGEECCLTGWGRGDDGSEDTDTGGHIEAMNKWKWRNDCSFIELRYILEEDYGAFPRKLANSIVGHPFRCS
jgi:hypothetical protein